MARTTVKSSFAKILIIAWIKTASARINSKLNIVFSIVFYKREAKGVSGPNCYIIQFPLVVW